MPCRFIIVALVGCMLSLGAAAQDYPHKPVRMLVGWPPGGTVDLIGRVVAQLLTEKLHQQVVVDNRPGASGMIVDQMVAAAVPDGYVLQTAGSTHATNPSLYTEAKYDPVKAGKTRALAVTTEARSSLLPDTPTLIESGFPGFEISGYFGVYGPPQLPANIVNAIGGTINAALKTPEMQQRLARLGAEPVGGSPESFTAFLRRDVDTWSKVIREAGIKAN